MEPNAGNLGAIHDYLQYFFKFLCISFERLWGPSYLPIVFWGFLSMIIAQISPPEKALF